MFKENMMKIFVLCVIISVAAARPGYLPAEVALPSYEHYAYAPTLVGHTVEHLPTAISHQSQTIVHEKRPYLRPILDYQPAAAFVKTHYSPPVHYGPVEHAKYVEAAPLTYAPIAYRSELYPSAGWNTDFTYSKGWNGWPLK